mmetsp:Transcript_12118/g.21042  ORF Transcript_12118/g.21042 Transcript_12118/m.21042 type:complete len:111 (+) Transcript_12118:47-379(+)
MAHYELYRKSSIGQCLTDILDDLVNQNTLSSDLAMKVLVQFDKSINEALAAKAKSKTAFKGHLHTYRFCDNVWTFILENANFKTDTETVSAELVKIVACAAKTTEEAAKL